MNEQDGGTEKYGLVIVGIIVLLVVSGVLALGISTARHAVSAPGPSTRTEAPSSFEQLRFAPGQDILPIDAQVALGRITDTARGNAGAVVVISSAFDASTDAPAHQDLAQRRVQQVRHALEANGVSPAQLVTVKPMALPAGSDTTQADRVEMRLQ